MQIGGFVKDFRPRDELQTVFIGQAEIRQHHVKILAFEQMHRRLRILGDIHVIAFFERGAQSFARRLLVVHNQQGRFFSAIIFNA